MSVKLNSSGGGSVTLQEPVTASVRTLTLPDGDGTVQMRQLMTAQTASGTSVNFTDIPSWAKRLTVILSGVSTNGTSNILIQLGAGSVTTSGYTSQAIQTATAPATSAATSTAGLVISGAFSATALYSGCTQILALGSNLWASSGTLLSGTAGNANYSGGTISLAGALDRVRITTVNGTDTFDAGTINVLYEG